MLVYLLRAKSWARCSLGASLASKPVDHASIGDGQEPRPERSAGIVGVTDHVDRQQHVLHRGLTFSVFDLTLAAPETAVAAGGDGKVRAALNPLRHSTTKRPHTRRLCAARRIEYQ